jgi:SAM-dependent methyltransferase
LNYNDYALAPTKKIAKLVSRYSRGLSLDAGCGKGVYFGFYKGTVIGLDVNPVFLKIAKNNFPKNKNVFLILGDVRFLPFKDRVFDFILCSQVIEHLSEYDARKAIRELERVARGLIIVDTPNVSFIPEFVRKIIYGKSSNLNSSLNPSPLYHHSIWTIKKLKLEGFDVRGSIGWTTRERIKLDFLWDLYDVIAWYIPQIAGNIIGIKYIYGRTRFK